jgi:hypothetical protein
MRALLLRADTVIVPLVDESLELVTDLGHIGPE